MWHTDEAASSIVEFEPNSRLGYNAYEGMSAPAYSCSETVAEPVVIHAVTLRGLTTCWEYFYRVRSENSNSGSAVSEGATFRTAPDDDAPFRFVTIGDSMVMNDIFAHIAGQAHGYRPDILVGSGDIVFDTITRACGDFFGPAKQLLSRAPFFGVMGNHDSNSEMFTQHFSFPEPRLWYSFNYGCAHFTMLNSNMDFSPGSEQYAWLENDLTMFEPARWKFVFFHHPPYCSNSCETEKIRVLCPLLEQAGVDIVYNAHATHYERLHPIKAASYNSNGIVYLLTGGGGCDPSASYGQLWDHLHPFSAMAKGSVNFFALTHVAPDEVRVRIIDTEDRIIDTLVLNKPQSALPVLPSAPVPLQYPERHAEGSVIAGIEESCAKWVLPRPHFRVDDEVRHGDGVSICWANEDGMISAPATRRAIVDDGYLGDRVEGRNVSLSAWVKTEGVSGGVTVSLEWNTDAGLADRVKSEPIAGTRDWTEVKITTDRLHGRVYALRILASAEPGSTGRAWFDGIHIELPTET